MAERAASKLFELFSRILYWAAGETAWYRYELETMLTIKVQDHTENLIYCYCYSVHVEVSITPMCCQAAMWFNSW